MEIFYSHLTKERIACYKLVMIIVSACLAGINCAYNGKNNREPIIESLVKKGKAIPLCPEQLSGFSTPRLRMEIIGGDGKDVLKHKAKVVNIEGENVTNLILNGVKEVFKIVKLVGAKEVIFKDKSPSCGVKFIHSGKFDGKLKKGMGLCSAFLHRKGIKVKGI